MLELWRSMAAPPDAWRLPGMTDHERGGTPADWRDRWLSATTWWADAVGGQRALPGASARLLTEIVEGLARAFRGRRFAFELAGRRLRGKLAWILLGRREGDYAVWLEL